MNATIHRRLQILVLATMTLSVTSGTIRAEEAAQPAAPSCSRSGGRFGAHFGGGCANAASVAPAATPDVQKWLHERLEKANAQALAPVAFWLSKGNQPPVVDPDRAEFFRIATRLGEIVKSVGEGQTLESVQTEVDTLAEQFRATQEAATAD